MTNTKIKLTLMETFLDGGTKECEGSDGNYYYVDHRLGTVTPGGIYDFYPGSENSKQLSSDNFELVPEL